MMKGNTLLTTGQLGINATKGRNMQVSRTAILFLVAFYVAHGIEPQDCQPPCRKGFICSEGSCVPRCNPPCPPGFVCNADGDDCVTKSVEKNTSPIQISEHVHSFHVGSSILYGISSAYSGIAPVIWAIGNFRLAEDGEFESDGYDTDPLIATGPQSSGVMIFGLLNQIPKAVQRKKMAQLNSKHSGLYVSGWALYAASLATNALAIMSFLGDKQGPAVTMSVTNCTVTLASCVVNVASYQAHRSLILENNRAISNKVEVLPYLVSNKSQTGAGFTIKF